MRFSLQASVITAGTLIPLGTAQLIQQFSQRTRYLATIPLLFGLQQIPEAIIWYQQWGTPDPVIVSACAYVFLSFAYGIWPLWVPCALWCAEQQTKRKKILLSSIVAGVLTSGSLLWILITGSLNVHTGCGHILYATDIPVMLHIPLAVTYLYSTILPWFVSSIPNLWTVGVLLAASCAYTAWAYTETFGSVWCFFAAIISCIMTLALNKHLQH